MHFKDSQEFYQEFEAPLMLCMYGAWNSGSLGSRELLAQGQARSTTSCGSARGLEDWLDSCGSARGLAKLAIDQAPALESELAK